MMAVRITERLGGDSAELIRKYRGSDNTYATHRRLRKDGLVHGLGRVDLKEIEKQW